MALRCASVEVTGELRLTVAVWVDAYNERRKGPLKSLVLLMLRQCDQKQHVVHFVVVFFVEWLPSSIHRLCKGLFNCSFLPFGDQKCHTEATLHFSIKILMVMTTSNRMSFLKDGICLSVLWSASMSFLLNRHTAFVLSLANWMKL